MTDTTGSAPAGTPAGTPPAGSLSAAIGSPSGIPNAPAPSAWTDGIADQDLRGFVTGRGWKDPGSLAESYRNLEKLTGAPADQILRLPKDDADVDGWKSVWNRLGRPETPDGYKLPVPAGMAPEFAAKAGAKFHELGIPAKQATALTEWWNQEQSIVAEAKATEQAQKSELELQKLRQEWGSTYEVEVEKGKRAARQFGLDEATLSQIESGFGTSATMKLFARIGAALGEGQFVVGDNDGSGGFGLSKEAAESKLRELRADPEWTDKYLKGDRAVRAEMSRLMELAYG